MEYRELLILLPCHSLEDFPTHHEGDDAANLLALWTVLWHPQLIASAGHMPVWGRVDDAPQDVQNKLIAIPQVSKDRLPTGFTQRAREAGAILLRNQNTRAPLLETALEPLGGANADAELAADFLALGYAWLQIQLLTRQMRYSSNLDEIFFNEQVVAAARAIVAGDPETGRERLSACFSLLGEERDRYYPVDAHLIDLTMVAPSTLGAGLQAELKTSSNNLLLNAELLPMLASQSPETLEQLKTALKEGRLALIGGELGEPRLPLLALEDVHRTIDDGLNMYAAQLDARPAVYGRRRFGLMPSLPSILRRFGFQGALHATLEDGRFPEGTQLKVSWEGRDGTSLDAIARPPLDASAPKTFLQLCTKLGESMDHDHVATLQLAHWPGAAAEFMDDLRRTARYTHCLGKLVTLDTYFSVTATAGQIDRFDADRYRSPYLKQAVIRKMVDPVTAIARYWRNRALFDQIEVCRTLAEWIGGRREAAIPDFQREILSSAEGDGSADLTERLMATRSEMAARLAGRICSGSSDAAGLLVLNPYACVRRLTCDHVPLAQLPAPAKPVYAVGQQDDRKQAVVDVPGHGFAYLPSGRQPLESPRNMQSLVSGNNVLRNEFFEAVIHPVTGVLQSVHTYNSRRNRLSQQLALRTPGAPGKTGEVYRDPDETAEYSVMAADECTVICATAACGEIAVRGRLLSLHGEEVARYRQSFRVWRGSRVLGVVIELEPLLELKPDPWSSYFASRFAWGEEAVDVARSVQQQYCPTTAKNMEAPHYIEVGHVEERTVLLTGGLPWHRRVAPAVIDTLLITRGETGRRFEIGFGIDVPYPLHESLAMLAPAPQIPVAGRPPGQDATGWLLHVDCRNVVVTHLVNEYDGDRVSGFRVRLMEVAGRSVEPRISAFRPVVSAELVDFRGQTIQACDIMEGNIKLRVAAHEWLEVVAHW